jgi:hypothetical protein
MDPKIIYEITGYAAAFLIAVSLLLNSLLRLRIISLIGAVCLTAYGLFIGAYPIVAVCLVVIGFNLYYVYQAFAARNYFTLLEAKHDSEYLQLFLKFHDQEIKRFLPDFTYLPSEQSLVFFVLRDMAPAALFIGDARGGGLWVYLDFVAPGYRDFSIGNFLFKEKAGFFKEQGIRKFVSASGNPAHTDCLRRMGFTPDSSDPSRLLYSREIG